MSLHALLSITLVTGNIQVNEKIDLTHWRLTLPIDQNSDGKPDGYWPDEMREHLKTDRLKPYFFRTSEGAIAFYCLKSDDIATTPNSKYPRTELREHVVLGRYDINWMLQQGGSMSGVLKVPRYSPGVRFMVMQIHGRLSKEQRELLGQKDNNAPPLFKIYFNDGKIEVAYKVLKNQATSSPMILDKSSWQDAPHYFFEQEVGNEKFDLTINATENELIVTLNDQTKTFSEPDLAKWPFENYFKAGNYLNSTTNGAYSEVHYYNLEVKH